MAWNFKAEARTGGSGRPRPLMIRRVCPAPAAECPGDSSTVVPGKRPGLTRSESGRGSADRMIRRNSGNPAK
eukprot:16386-Hanusia_phi.AAC.1